MIKQSLKKIINQFDKYDQLVKDFMEQVLIVEDDKINVSRPQIMSNLENKLDKIVNQSFDDQNN